MNNASVLSICRYITTVVDLLRESFPIEAPELVGYYSGMGFIVLLLLALSVFVVVIVVAVILVAVLPAGGWHGVR
jgi:uncharacterized membrane protein